VVPWRGAPGADKRTAEAGRTFSLGWTGAKGARVTEGGPLCRFAAISLHKPSKFFQNWVLAAEVHLCLNPTVSEDLWSDPEKQICGSCCCPTRNRQFGHAGHGSRHTAGRARKRPCGGMPVPVSGAERVTPPLFWVLGRRIGCMKFTRIRRP